MLSEKKIADGPGIVTVVGGGGLAGDAARLRAKLDAVDLTGVQAVISFGVTGGMDPSLHSGDVVLGTRVATVRGESWATDPVIVDRIAARLASAGIAARRGVVGAQDEVTDLAAEERLHAATSGLVIDEESHIAAEFAARHHLPFATLRAVDAEAGQALPAVALQSLRSDGSIDYAAILRGLSRDSSQWNALMALARAADKAFASLTAARCSLRVQDFLRAPLAGLPVSAAEIRATVKARGEASVNGERVVREADFCASTRALPYSVGACRVGLACQE